MRQAIPGCKLLVDGVGSQPAKLADEYGPRGFTGIGFKFDTMPDMEDPIQFVKRISVRDPLAVATNDLKRKFGGI